MARNTQALTKEYAQRAEDLETAIVEASAELDRADGSRVGMQEAIDAAQEILREAYGDDYDTDVSNYLADDGSNDDEDEDE